jgi:tRNA (guanine6-N2)-methyltransferase
VETPPGLEEFTRAELKRLALGRLRWSGTPPQSDGELQFAWLGSLLPLTRLACAHAVYLIARHPVPRPKALLGHEHFHRLLAQIDAVLRMWPDGTFHTLYLSAAGSGSSVMERLKDELAAHTGLAVASHEGDLLLRLRRAPGAKPGWETLVRLSPRPLTTRSWRVCNYEGALNAVAAQAMSQLTRPAGDDIFVNLACGSGSLLLERLANGPSRLLLGIDQDVKALDCARQNLIAYGNGNLPPGVDLLRADAGETSLPAGLATALAADLPFGHLVGSHQANVNFYPRVLREAARLAAPQALFCLITHELHLVEDLLQESPSWEVRRVIKTTLGGLNPRIFVLKRKPS